MTGDTLIFSPDWSIGHKYIFKGMLWDFRYRNHYKLLTKEDRVLMLYKELGYPWAVVIEQINNFSSCRMVLTEKAIQVTKDTETFFESLQKLYGNQQDI